MAGEDSTATADPKPPRARGDLGSTIGLSVLLTLGPLFVLGPLIWQLAPITDLPAPFADQHQTAETLIFLLAFAVLLPAAILGAPWIADRIASGPDPRALSPTLGLLGAGLAGVVLVARMSPDVSLGDRPRALALAAMLWGVAAAVALGLAATRSRVESGRAGRGTGPWRLALLSLVPVALSFVDSDSIARAVLCAGAGGLAATALYGRVRPPRMSGWVGGALDAALIVLLAVAVPNVLVLPIGDPARALDTALIQFHQNFYLGPANQLLAGDHMLVEVLSQYGVGSICFLAAAFRVVPIGYGMLGLIEGGISALMFVATFTTLRIAGVSRWLAATAMGVAVVALVYGLAYPLGALLQHGAFRFGHPVGVVLGAVVAARWPRWALPARLLQLLAFAIASIWALEAFVFTLFTLFAVAAADVATRPVATRARASVGWGAQIAASGLLAHLLFAMSTIVVAGQLPNWGWYLDTLREFLTGRIGDWTYDFSSFSPGHALGALYLASAAALALVLRRRSDLCGTERTLLVAIAGTTAHGVALFSYLVNRSLDHIIPYVSLPAIALGALWLTFVDRPAVAVPASGRRVAIAAALASSGLLVAAAWPRALTRYPESALAHLVSGGSSLRDALDRIVEPVPVRVEAPEGVALLRTHLPGERRSVVLTGADLSVEILMRAGRANAVPFGDPWEDSFVATSHLAPLGAFVDRLRAGERVLIDLPAAAAFDAHRADPSLDPLEFPIVPEAMAPLQRWVLREIGCRFDLRTVARGGSGLAVVELVPRAGAGGAGSERLGGGCPVRRAEKAAEGTRAPVAERDRASRAGRRREPVADRRCTGRWQIATTSRASCRPVLRSSKSWTPIASARGSGRLRWRRSAAS